MAKEFKQHLDPYHPQSKGQLGQLPSLAACPEGAYSFQSPAFCSARHMQERLTDVPCTFCNRPVRLDKCGLNDLGEPAHEACLAEQYKEEIKKLLPPFETN